MFHPIAGRLRISQPRLTPRERARAARLRNARPLGFPDSPEFRVRERNGHTEEGGNDLSVPRYVARMLN
jgi:hypothetical protein